MPGAANVAGKGVILPAALVLHERAAPLHPRSGVRGVAGGLACGRQSIE